MQSKPRRLSNESGDGVLCCRGVRDSLHYRRMGGILFENRYKVEKLYLMLVYSWRGFFY
jgi:hypothetical protein